MKHKIRDIFIWLVSVTGITFLYRAYMKHKGPLVRVLCFHDVADCAWFEGVIALCVEKYNVLTPEQFHRQEFSREKINILLTFDDGYQSWVDNCLPMLEKYKCKGLFFINSGLLDISEEKESVDKYMQKRLLITPKIALSWDGARSLLKHGHYVGGHTVTHPNLMQLEINEVHRELLEDKNKIEEKLGIILCDFSYPFGQKSNYNEAVIEETGQSYKKGFAAWSAFVVETTGFEIPRLCIEQNQPLQSVQCWIEGGYDIFKYIT